MLGLRSMMGVDTASQKRPGSDIIPAERLMDWKPGIPGGIPTYPVFASVKDVPYNAKGDGQADDTGAIQKAIDACPEGKAVYLPEGTYRLTDELNLSKGVVLRGDGPGKTRLINEATRKSSISIGGPDEEAVTAKVTKGCVKGSERITVDDGSKFTVGDLVLIDELNDEELVSVMGCGGKCGWASRDEGARAMGQMAQVKAKEGNELVLGNRLAFTFKEGLAPEVVRMTSKPVTGAGVEDLYLEMTRGRVGRDRNSAPIYILNGVHCWVKNVESYKNWWAGHVTLKTSLGCEVRDSYFHHFNRIGGGFAYGVWVYYHTTDTLVENNTFYYLIAGIIAECGGPGNVFGYNFSTRMFGRDYPDTVWAHPDMAMHGAHDYMNLFEGNCVTMFMSDYYWGSASHTTLFRNRVDMDWRSLAGGPVVAVIGIRIDKKNYFMNVVGNVLGREGMEGVVEIPTITNYDRAMVWRLGYSTPSGKGPTADPKVAENILRHGNYDFISKKAHWDPKIASHKLPKSLYLAAKPAWFGDLPWPAIGPDVKPMTGTIPARERFLKLPREEREAQDALFLGEFLLNAGKQDKAREAFQQVLEKHGDTTFAVEARKHLEEMK